MEKYGAQSLHLRKKLPAFGLPCDIINQTASELLKPKNILLFEKLNLALELAADPQFENARNYFKNQAESIISSQGWSRDL